MAWSSSPTVFCLQEYHIRYESRILVFGGVHREDYKIVDETYIATGMDEATAKKLADDESSKDGVSAQARKAYASDGWEVSKTVHTKTREGA